MHQANHYETMAGPVPAARPGAAFPSRAAAVLLPLWLAMASSSIVMVEPAPFDLLAVGLFAFYFAIGLRVPQGLNGAMLAAALFLLANAASIVFAPAAFSESLPYMTFYAALTVYLFALWVVIASLVAADPTRVLRVIWNGWLVAALFAAALAIGAYFRLLPGADLFMAMGRAKAAFKDPNVYGPFLIPVMLYLLSRLQRGQPVANVLRFGAFLFLVVGILLGFSRGAWGNLVASLLVFGVLAFLNARTLRDYARLILAGIALLAVCVSFLAAAISVPTVSEMFAKRASILQHYDVNAGGRFSTQLAALETVGAYPLGIGPNRTKPYLARNPHNVYIKVFAENGWLGGIAFAVFIGLTVWRGFAFAIRPGPLQRDFVVVYACTLGIVAESVIIDTLHWRHYFVLLGMLWGMMLAAPSHTRNPTDEANAQ